MSDFFRRIAPAVLVGTAAVAVAASAGAETPTATAATGGTTTEPDGTQVPPGNGSGNEDELLDWRAFGFDDDDRDEDDHDDDDDDDDRGRSQGGGTAAAPPATGSGNSGGTATSPSTSGATSAACDASEVVGPTVSTEWGPVQVAARVVNGRVCAIRTIQTPDGDRKSVMINARAVPSLEAQVIAAGSANIDGVSGATVTTVGYRKSLQAILDAAK